MKKRLLSLLLCCAMLFSLCMQAVFAEGVQGSGINPAEQPGTECTCETLCTAEEKNTDCPVCGIEGADLTLCKGAETAIPSEAEKSPVEEVQKLIDSLPNADEIGLDNAEDVKAKLEAIDKATAEFSAEELEKLDFSRYMEAAAVLERLYDVAAPSNAVMLADYNGPALMPGASDIPGYNNGYHFVYYGEWDGDPIKWRVLDDQTNTGKDGLFLLSDVLLGTGKDGDVYFNKAGTDNAWKNSAAQEWCENLYEDNLTDGEQGAVLATTKSDEAFTSSTNSINFAASGDILHGDKVFFLSAQEVENKDYGFTNDNARIANYGERAGTWWLRSPCASVFFYEGAGGVNDHGNVYYNYVYYYNKGNTKCAARPAFNLDQNSVLFTSAAAGGKPEGGLQAVGDYTGSEWKLTLHDSGRDGFTARKTDDCTITYSGAKTGNNEYISVLIQDDSTQEYTHYGRLAKSEGSGTVEVPLTFDMTGKTLYVFNEQYNGDKMTDYASALQTVDMERNAYAITNNLTDVTTSNPATYHMMNGNADYTATLTPANGYVLLTEDIRVKMGDRELTAGTDYTYDPDNGKLCVFNVSGDIEIIAAGQQAKLEITVSTNTLTFDARHVGYKDAPEAQSFEIENTGNQKITDMVVAFSAGSDTNSFSVSCDGGLLPPPLEPGEKLTFTVQPKGELAAKTHQATVNIGGDDISGSVTLTFEVTDHDFDSWKSNFDGTHTGTCTQNGCKEERTENCSTSGGTCSKCNYHWIVISAQPESQTVKEGEIATFSVAATGSHITSYQWQVSTDSGVHWTDIDKATDTSYTAPAATLDMNGNQYRVVVSNSSNKDDKKESAAATLTVQKGPTIVEPVFARYIVEHYKADKDSSTGYTLSEREYLIGEIGETVTATPKNYAGYTYNAEKSTTSGELKKIDESDTLTLKLYYDLTMFTVTVESDNHGAASATPSSAEMGTEIKLTANPDAGYRFERWEVVSGGITITDDVFIMPAANVTVKAIFGRNSGGSGAGGDTSCDCFTITASAGAGGSISPSGSISVREKLDKTFTITPNDGYRISDVLVDGKSVGAVSSYTFENVRAQHTIEAVFVKENQRTGIDNPQTGDNNNMRPWVFLTLVSLSALIVLTVMRRRKPEGEETLSTII